MQRKQDRNSFTSSHGWAGVQAFPGKQGSITSNSDLRRKCYGFIYLLLPTALCTEQDAIWPVMSLGTVGVSCPVCVPAQLLVHPQPTHWWAEERCRRSLGSV